MATHSSVLAWRIPGTEEPTGLLSVGSHRVGHDWSDLVGAAATSKKLKGKVFFKDVVLIIIVDINLCINIEKCINSGNWYILY